MRYIGKKQAIFLLDCSRATLDRLRKTDPAFPKGHKRLGKRNAQVKWIESDILAYMQR